MGVIQQDDSNTEIIPTKAQLNLLIRAAFFSGPIAKRAMIAPS
jgi:hypothetical protein